MDTITFSTDNTDPKNPKLFVTTVHEVQTEELDYYTEIIMQKKGDIARAKVPVDVAQALDTEDKSLDASLQEIKDYKALI